MREMVKETESDPAGTLRPGAEHKSNIVQPKVDTYPSSTSHFHRLNVI